MSNSDLSFPGRIRIRWDGGLVTVTLRDTPTARKLWQHLPMESRAQTWGEEVYFRTPVEAALESDARQKVAPGDVCFWCEGGALALPYGRTPMSIDCDPMLVSACNQLGKIEQDAKALASIRDGMRIHVEADQG